MQNFPYQARLRYAALLVAFTLTLGARTQAQTALHCPAQSAEGPRLGW
jgi:hypothetical protein